MNNTSSFYNQNFPYSLKEEQQQIILVELKELFLNDKLIEINNNKLPRFTLVLFHLINDYHLAYTKAIKEKVSSKKNTLESLGKGNRNRKKRYENNENLINDETANRSLRAIAKLENLILKLIIKGNYKFAYLILSLIFVNKHHLDDTLKVFFSFNSKADLVKDSFEKALEFYEFTYLSPDKIVNSCAISLFQYLKLIKDID